MNEVHKLMPHYISMIVPAKWASRKEAESVRKKYQSKLTSITYYPETTDVFRILEPSGVCYYLWDRDANVEQTEVRNRCSMVKSFNSEVHRSLGSKFVLNNFGSEVIALLGDYMPFHFDESDFSDQYGVYVTNMAGYGGGSQGKNFYSRSGDAQVIQRYEILELSKESYSAQQCRLCFTGTKAECESWVSYVYSKFVRFLVLMGLDRSSVLNDITFRFVPAIESYDHIYTDAELYRKYNLTDSQVNVIESVIRERY